MFINNISKYIRNKWKNKINKYIHNRQTYTILKIFNISNLKYIRRYKYMHVNNIFKGLISKINNEKIMEKKNNISRYIWTTKNIFVPKFSCISHATFIFVRWWN